MAFVLGSLRLLTQTGLLMEGDFASVRFFFAKSGILSDIEMLRQPLGLQVEKRLPSFEIGRYGNVVMHD